MADELAGASPYSIAQPFPGRTTAVHDRRWSTRALWGLVAAMMVVLMYKSVTPATTRPVVSVGDKVAHALAYGALAVAVVAALRRGSSWGAGRVALVAFGWATAYGALAEVIQAFVGRVADVWDGMANAAGAGLVVLVFLCLAARRAG